MQRPAKQALNREGLTKTPGMGGTTPVPNDLLDRAMPMLRDTELRVLLIVVRQTLGWQSDANPARRKARDWLTQSQLMRRTGRASGAVSHAVEALVQAGLIIVTDRSGKLLKAAGERRRHLGHLYYELGSGGESVDNLPKNVDNSCKSEHAKAHTTKETVIQKYRGNKEVQDNSMEVQDNSMEVQDNSMEVQDNSMEIQDKSKEMPFVIRNNQWNRAAEVKPRDNSSR